MADKDASVLSDLDALVEPTSRGDPMLPLRWTCKSTHRLAAELKAKSHEVSQRTICDLLSQMHFSLQSTRKTREGGKAGHITLTPLALIDRIAALVPPPRTHRHRYRYFGVLAPNSPLRAAVTALAAPAQPTVALAQPITTGACVPAVAPLGNAVATQPEPTNPMPPKRSPAHYLWAVLIARIYEVLVD